MQTTALPIRQFLGCGYAPPPKAGTPVDPWSAPRGDRATVCPGYTTKLPEVIEAARARFHWEKGALGMFCEGELPTELLMRSIEILASASNDCSDYYMTPANKGGGGQ
jgi:hypothetical protein